MNEVFKHSHHGYIYTCIPCSTAVVGRGGANLSWLHPNIKLSSAKTLPKMQSNQQVRLYAHMLPPPRLRLAYQSKQNRGLLVVL